MLDPFTKTRFHADLNLETWYPEGVLDRRTAEFMAKSVAFEERVLDEPFNRFADLSNLTGIQLDFVELANIAAVRRAAYEGRPPVKAAILAISRPAYGTARMFAALMEGSPIDVQIFRKVENAAHWLGVPVEALRADS